MRELLAKYEDKSPEIVFHWNDPETEAEGWVVINSLRGGAAGGGTRMRKGLNKNEVLSLAKTMEVKFTVSGPAIGGAKSGINFDPKDPRKKGVLERWYKAVSPLLKSYYGTGGDLNVDEIHEVISQPKADNPYFSHGFTYSGHALACGVSLKNIEIIERENLCGHVKQWGPYFYEQLKSLESLPIVGEVRGSHYMLALEYVQNKGQKTAFADEVSIGKRVYAHCKKRGLMLRPIGALNILSPPLTFDKQAIDQTVSILRASILATVEELKHEQILSR